MQKLRFTVALVVALSWVSLAQAAPTIQDFSADFPPPDVNTSPIEPFGTVEIIDAWDGNALRLTEEINDQNNGFALPQMVAGAYDSLVINFDFSISPGNGGGADGMGFVYAPVADWTASAAPFPNHGLSEEPNLGGALGVGFDTFNNTDQGDGGENSISLHWDGARLDSVIMDDEYFPEEFLESGDTLNATIGIVPSGAGSNVSVTLVNLDSGDSFVAYENEFVDGLTPYDGRVVIKGRTGGANSEQIVDNISLELTPQGGGDPITAMEDFSQFEEGIIAAAPPGPLPPLVGGTPFERFSAGTNPPADVVSVSGEGGVGDGYLRMTANTGSQSNSVAFDKTSDTATDINARFKFRIDDSGNNADGMSFVILDTDIYDDSGPLETVPSEEPNLAGAFGIGFDTFDNDEEGIFDPDGCGNNGACVDRRANHISIHWDGVQVIENIPLEGFDLVNGEWNTANLIATEVDGGMNVTFVIEDADGNGIVVAVDEFIEGMSFPNGARAAFGGRTGGAASLQLVDDVNISWDGASDPCDLNGDGAVDVADIDAMREQIMAGGAAQADLIQLVEGECFNTYIGDANLDGEFNSGDFVFLFTAGEYDDGIVGNSTWATGDFNADGEFDSGDFVAAFTQGGYEQGPRGAVAAVPEPTSAVLLLIGGLLAIRRRK